MARFIDGDPFVSTERGAADDDFSSVNGASDLYWDVDDEALCNWCPRSNIVPAIVDG